MLDYQFKTCITKGRLKIIAVNYLPPCAICDINERVTYVTRYRYGG